MLLLLNPPSFFNFLGTGFLTDLLCQCMRESKCQKINKNHTRNQIRSNFTIKKEEFRENEGTEKEDKRDVLRALDPPYEI